MIRIRFDEPSGDDWRRWRLRCKRATEKVVVDRGEGMVTKFDDSLYREMKSIYLSLDGPFHGKCAYCESLFAVDQPGDIDHFRPKSEVRNIDNQVVTMLDHKGNRSPHPGYYWLAYDWRNLLPSCRDCNTPSKWKTKGKSVGKGCRFPVRTDHAILPGKEADEQPLLIKPTGDEDPSTHLEIDCLGIVIAKTDRGHACNEVFGLNDREALVRKRQEAFEDATEAVVALFDAARAKEPERITRSLKRLQRFADGEAAYAAAGRAGIKQALPTFHSIAIWLSDTYERFIHVAHETNDTVTDSPEISVYNVSEPIGSARVTVCLGCGEIVPHIYVERLITRGTMTFDCPCGETVSLAKGVA